MTDVKPIETIQLAVLDSVLYGAARAVEYLGPRGQVMLEKIGGGIVEYCIKEGYVEPSDKWENLIAGLRAFFERNGYLGRMEITKEGETVTEAIHGYQYLGLKKKLRDKGWNLYACPWCVAEDAVTRGKATPPDLKQISEEILSDGTYVRKYKVAQGSESEPAVPVKPLDSSVIRAEGRLHAGVGLPVFEAVEYGLGRGFAYLGAQAQLLLDSVGSGVIEFLHDEFQLNLSGNPTRSLEVLASFYASRGLADKLEIQVSSSRAKAHFTRYRYAPVLKRLLEERLNLASCPFTLAARSVLRNAGFAVQDMEWKMAESGDVTLTMPFLNIADQQFDEDSIAGLMDSV